MLERKIVALQMLLGAKSVLDMDASGVCRSGLWTKRRRLPRRCSKRATQVMAMKTNVKLGTRPESWT